MPSKSEPQTETKKPDKKIGSLICGFRSPGPKYPLKTLVGYQEHCISKYRNPAYTFGKRFLGLRVCETPGPKYLLDKPKRGGFTFGLAGKVIDTSCTPGPKYILPAQKTPAFTIKSRTKYKTICFTPGPYNVRLPIPGPAFSIGRRLHGVKCDPVPGCRPYSDLLVKLRAPMFTIGRRVDEKIACRTPGPKYHPTPPKPRPMYSFGVKHSECAPPYITECDNDC